MELSLQCGRAG